MNRYSNHDTDTSYNFGIQLLIRDTFNPAKIIFDNKESGGIKLYRPLEKSTSKENNETIVKTNNDLQTQESKLEEQELLTSSGEKIKLNHRVIVSMLDGKSRKAITEDVMKKARGV